jgi:hypothetical protein
MQEQRRELVMSSISISGIHVAAMVGAATLAFAPSLACGESDTALRAPETVELVANAWDKSGDGSVIVGDFGPTPTELVATRWVNGAQEQLQVVGTRSSARFVSDDGTTALGWAEVGGRTVLVRWDGEGWAHVVAPPEGTSVEEILGLDPAGTLASGTLSRGDARASFVWTKDTGIRVESDVLNQRDWTVR